MTWLESLFLLEAPASEVGAAAIAPTLILLWGAIAAANSPPPPRRVWAAFALGAAGSIAWRYAPLPVGDRSQETVSAFLLLAAVPEESVKLAAIAVFAARRTADATHALVYGAAVGLGFAAAESLFLIMGHLDDWRLAALIRATLTVPLHGALGMIGGAYVAAARSADESRTGGWRTAARLAALAWAVPVVLHFAFDASLFYSVAAAASAAAGAAWQAAAGLIVIGSVVLALRLWAKMRARPVSPAGVPASTTWRLWWALLAASGGAAMLGAALIGAELRRRYGQSAFLPQGPAPLVVGGILLAIGAAVHYWGQRNLFGPTTRTR